jgi:signal transduction histidine kinase
MSWLSSLRTKIVVMLATAAIVAAVAAGLLAYGLDTSRRLIDKSQAAQARVEEYLLLIGRVSDYGNAVTAAASAPQSQTAPQRIADGYVNANQVFDNLNAMNVAEVERESGDAKSAAATKGLVLARMRAQFNALHESLAVDLDSARDLETVQARLDAFGLGFSPMLAQAIEDERQLSRRLGSDIDALRGRLTRYAAAQLLGTLLLGALLYYVLGRPLLRRINETVSGADAIAEGYLETRLKPTGRDELTALMSAFNRMASNLGARESELHEGQRNLQATIDRQTGDLRAANSRLESIDANRRRFFSDISHELRTPLTVVQGEAEFNLKPKAKPTAAQMRDSFRTILARVQGLRRRVDDLLRVARSESGTLDLVKLPVDAVAIVHEAVAAEADLCKRRSIRLSANDPETALMLEADREWIRQVLSGLIGNAVKHTNDGGTIDVSVRGNGAVAELTVSDSGEGFDANELPNLFDRFMRGKKASPGTDGFGIGLSLAKWVVEEHGGSISAANRSDGQGAMVEIRLPLIARKGKP